MSTLEKRLPFSEQPKELVPWIVGGGLLLAVLAAYWNTLSLVVRSWENPMYSHGWVVPAGALLILFVRRRPISTDVPTATRWIGAGIIVGGMTLRLIAAYFSYAVVDHLSLIPCLMGVVMLVGGWSMLSWTAPGIAFLVFMFPLPDFIVNGLLHDLQSVATIAGTYVLQTLSLDAYRSGTVIHLPDTPLNVAEACSGLRMSTVLLALCVGVALIIERPLWERITIVISAVPIALASNIMRLTATGLLLYWNPGASHEYTQNVHDYAGFAMMIPALGMVYLEMKFLENLFIEDEDGHQLTFRDEEQRKKKKDRNKTTPKGQVPLRV